MKISNPAKVAILMATYNGARFLAEQIDSIIHQDFTDWTLFIQDDGSTDETLDIIKRYEIKDPRIKHIDVGLSRQGATMNFMSLLNMIESEYYMFSDQDDVWMHQKIKLEFDKMKEVEDGDKPVLIGSDKTRVDEKLNIILNSEFIHFGASQEEQYKVLKERSKINMLRCLCPVAGCTMFFNHAAKVVSIPFLNLRYQDSIVSMAVVKNGGVMDYVLEPTMYYRLHSLNTCGVNERPMLSKLIRIKENVDGMMRMYNIFKMYGGKGVWTFLYCRWRLFRTFRAVNLYHR